MGEMISVPPHSTAMRRRQGTQAPPSVISAPQVGHVRVSAIIRFCSQAVLREVRSKLTTDFGLARRFEASDARRVAFILHLSNPASLQCVLDKAAQAARRYFISPATSAGLATVRAISARSNSPKRRRSRCQATCNAFLFLLRRLTNSEYAMSSGSATRWGRKA